jgi:hypothetical protein
VAGGENKAGFDPGTASADAVGVLLFLAKLQRDNADIRQRKRRFG